MKRFLVPVLLLLGASLTASRAEAQHFAHIGDTCLTLNWNGFESNPDSILVDTCLTLPGSSHAVFWVKGRYEIFFDSNAIPLGYGAPDSDLEVEWQAIDTAFPLIRNGFKAIYDSIGPFSLKKRDPSDTGDIGSHGFYLIFQNYVPN
ncbi:MAG: hypothetical protein Q8922_16115, partial [Bacteroidota bacterium]|nr:hypothetical protein [Bacteroidota bacterium]